MTFHQKRPRTEDDEEVMVRKRPKEWGEEEEAKEEENEGEEEEEEEEEDEEEEDEEPEVMVVDRLEELDQAWEEDLYRSIFHSKSQSEIEAEYADFTADRWGQVLATLLSNKLDGQSSEREVLDVLRHFYYLFTLHLKGPKQVIERMSVVYPDASQVRERRDQLTELCRQLTQQLKQKEKLGDDKRGREMQAMLHRIHIGLKITFDIAANAHWLQHAIDPRVTTVLERIDPGWICQIKDPKKMKKPQQLIEFYWHRAFKKEYCKDGDAVYRLRYLKDLEDGSEYPVYAYEYVCDMSHFVYDELFPLSENDYYAQLMMEKPGMARHVITILTDMKTEWFPQLQKNRDLLAFRNGIFDLDKNVFFFFRPPPTDAVVASSDSGRYWIKEWTGSGKLVAMKYHDVYFPWEQMNKELNLNKSRTDGIPHPMGVELPNVRKILEDQGFDAREQFWILGMCGRLLHELNRRERWTITPFFWGAGGTGKSTMLRLVASVFDPTDVGYLNNSGQKTFSLDGIDDKLLYLGLDVDENFTLDQVTWNSMTSGEEVSVTRKFKKPRVVEWKIPGAFAANKLFGWSDNAGSLARRLFMILFLQVIDAQDPMLMEKCQKELARFIFVINSCYLAMAKQYKNRGIKEVMPPKFRESEKLVLAETNPMSMFLSERFEMKPAQHNNHNNAAETKETYFILMKDMKEMYGVWAKENSVKQQWRASFYSPYLSKFRLKVIHPGDDDPLGQTSCYVLGVKKRGG